MRLIHSILSIATAAALLCVAAGCDKEKGRFETPEWEKPTQKPEPEKPDPEKPDPETPDPEKPEPPKPAKAKPLYIWIDAAANFPDFANSKENIARDLALAADAGFTDVVVDVRPTNGDILFKSDKEQQVAWLGAWVKGAYTKIERTESWDYLQAFIDEGHKLGLRVHAGFNTMVGGNSNLGGSGLLYRDKTKASWATCINGSSGIYSVADYKSGTLFFNPANDEVQAYLIGLLKDLASYPDLDGIILDRCRYDNIQSDFSKDTKQKFMDYMNLGQLDWEDVAPKGMEYGTIPSTYPKHFKSWLEFRAKVIHDFVQKASEAVHAIRPDIKFGVYVGGWYSQYFDVGVNWASPKYNPASKYKWASDKYKNYGYADHCDQILIGAYASPGAVWGSSEWTMQGFCALAQEKISDSCPLVVGGPDVGNWDSANKYSQEEENQAIVNSVKACYDACGGYFLFDMIHLKLADQWQYAKEGISMVK